MSETREPLQPKDGEKFIVFASGGRKYVGIQREPGEGVIREVYEVVMTQMIQPSSVQGGSPTFVSQTLIVNPDFESKGKGFIDEMTVFNMDWRYEPCDEAQKGIRENIKAMVGK